MWGRSGRDVGRGVGFHVRSLLGEQLSRVAFGLFVWFIIHLTLTFR